LIHQSTDLDQVGGGEEIDRRALLDLARQLGGAGEVDRDLYARTLLLIGPCQVDERIFQACCRRNHHALGGQGGRRLQQQRRT
jgi:hypothetical protein